MQLGRWEGNVHLQLVAGGGAPSSVRLIVKRHPSGRIRASAMASVCGQASTSLKTRVINACARLR